jgi:hypothetical protein
VAVKGKAKAVKVYELIGFRKLMAETALRAVEEYSSAFAAFVEGDFQSALFGFESYLLHFDPLDRVAKDHLQCCKEQLKTCGTRDTGWNCTVVLDDK